MRFLTRAVLTGVAALAVKSSLAATLTGSFSPIPQGSNVNLTAEGKLDWVHWGLQSESSLNRKATVIPQLSDFSVLYDTNQFGTAYQYTDNFNGYTWSDGTQNAAITNTTTGVWFYTATLNPTEPNGFQLVIPADTTLKTLKVYVGSYAARGRLQATLSDYPTSYSDTSLVNSSNGPGGVYTIQFAANAANQKLTIHWTIANRSRPDGNVTLQAATLTADGANNPPFVQIVNPPENAIFTAPANFSIAAEAFDPDGTISRVEFYTNGILAGESANEPSLTINDVPPGHYELTARPIDNGNGTSVSRPVDIFVHSSGGMLNGSIGSAPVSVDLTAEGNVDWLHLGLNGASSVNRKADVPANISSVNLIGTNALQQQTDSYAGYGWSDGLPITQTIETKTGVFISGITNGFQFSVPADTNSRTLKVYVGLYGGSGNFQAWLSDFSAPAFTDQSLTNAYGSSYAVYTLNYAAASAGRTLNVRYTSDYLFDQDYGNVALQAVTLNGSVPITPVYLFNFRTNSGDFQFVFGAEAGRAYTVQYTDSLSPIDWQTLTNIVGSGADETVTDSASHPQRFYRIQSN